MIPLTITAAASVLAGAVASVAGFGIGSILTPIFQRHHDMRLAVAAVSIPHAIATAVRCWRLRRNIDVHVLKSFGATSAAGGLVGAVLQRYASAPGLGCVFAALLIFAGVAALTGFSDRIRFGRKAGVVAGLTSGALGGLVGNQGGIRSAALLGYDLSPAAFVATATAAGLIVDAARMPVYLLAESARLATMLGVIGLATAGAVAGTVGGERVLKRIPHPVFRRIVGALIAGLGFYMFSRAS